MRKRLITATQATVRSHGKGWLDVERAAMIEGTMSMPNVAEDGEGSPLVQERGERCHPQSRRKGNTISVEQM
jgi:hypothetical protein